MSWANTYIGVPFAELGRGARGCDCWGLVVHVYGRELDIALPFYTGGYVSSTERSEISRLISRAETTGAWSKVETPDLLAFDLLVFREGRYRSHVGLALDARHMLHMAGRDQAKVETFLAPRWNSRLTGIYRHLETARRPTK